jgi:hypothetical protein
MVIAVSDDSGEYTAIVKYGRNAANEVLSGPEETLKFQMWLRRYQWST